MYILTFKVQGIWTFATHFRLCWKENVETVKSVITDVKWKYRVKLWNKIWIAATTMALENLLIFYSLLIFCFAAQNIITQDSIALRHYWWCKSISCSSGYSFSIYCVTVRTLVPWSLVFFLYFFFCRTRSVRPRENESIHFLLVRLISRKQICSRISTLGSLTSFSSRDTFQGACG